MRTNFGILIVVVLLLSSCALDQSKRYSIGEGFYLCPSGISTEMQPAIVSLGQESQGRVKVIWKALTASKGGPFSLGGGLLFCAQSKMGSEGLFVVSGQGQVAEVTAHVLPSRRVELRQIYSSDDLIRITFWDEAGQAGEISVAKRKLLELGMHLTQTGRKVYWGTETYSVGN